MALASIILTVAHVCYLGQVSEILFTWGSDMSVYMVVATEYIHGSSKNFNKIEVSLLQRIPCPASECPAILDIDGGSFSEP